MSAKATAHLPKNSCGNGQRESTADQTNSNTPASFTPEPRLRHYSRWRTNATNLTYRIYLAHERRIASCTRTDLVRNRIYRSFLCLDRTGPNHDAIRVGAENRLAVCTDSGNEFTSSVCPGWNHRHLEPERATAIPRSPAVDSAADTMRKQFRIVPEHWSSRNHRSGPFRVASTGTKRPSR